MSTYLPFREYHLKSFLQAYDASPNMPIDLCIHRYFQANKALGPKDRKNLAETVYGMIRWQGLLDFLCEGDISWDKRIEIYRKGGLEKYESDQSIPRHIRLSFPEDLFQLLVESHGEATACKICEICNRSAPTTVRANVLKTSRDALIARWQAAYGVYPCKEAPNGISFPQKLALFTLPEFKEGLFEVQDEGSQLVSAMVQAEPGQWVMDYCAGSGGKTLAFAPLMKGTGQIYLHDVRTKALMEAKKRLRRAGIQNAQIVLPEDPKLKKLKKRMDWVLVDAPCSGTGTLRRNPDMKWQFTTEMLRRLVGEQRKIFEHALSYMKPEGRIVYATCSILKQENENQVQHFLKAYNLQLEGEVFRSLPQPGGMDGFFAATFSRRQEQPKIHL